MGRAKVLLLTLDHRLDKIAQLEIETWDEDELVRKLEAGAAYSAKRHARDIGEDVEETEEDEKPAPKSKKRKTTKT